MLFEWNRDGWGEIVQLDTGRNLLHPAALFSSDLFVSRLASEQTPNQIAEIQVVDETQ